MIDGCSSADTSRSRSSTGVSQARIDACTDQIQGPERAFSPGALLVKGESQMAQFGLIIARTTPSATSQGSLPR